MSRGRNQGGLEDFVPIAEYCLIEEGKYSAMCKDAKFENIHAKPRAVIGFEIFPPSKHAGTRLRYYAVVGGPASKYSRAWVTAAGRPPKLGEKMLLDVFKGKVFTVTVETANKGKKDREYSVVRELLAVEAGR